MWLVFLLVGYAFPLSLNIALERQCEGANFKANYSVYRETWDDRWSITKIYQEKFYPSTVAGSQGTT